MYKIRKTSYTNIPLEAEEQKELVRWLNSKCIFFYATTNENNTFKQNRKYAMIAEQKAKAQGKKKGVSDLTIFLKDKIVFLELKRQRPLLKNGKLGVAKNKPSEEQIEFLESVNSYGYAVGVVAYGCDESIKIIEELYS